jgi:tetratricopeptide (TPR) repeat protein
VAAVFAAILAVIYSIFVNNYRNDLVNVLKTATLPQGIAHGEDLYDAIILCSQGFYDEGRQITDIVLSQDPNNAYGFYTRGGCDYADAGDIIRLRSYELGYWERANAKYEAAFVDYGVVLKAEFPPDSYLHERAYYVRGEISRVRYIHTGENHFLEQAMIDYTSMLDLHPDIARDHPIANLLAAAHFGIGELYYLSDESLLACTMLKRSIELTSNEILRGKASELIRKIDQCYKN